MITQPLTILLVEDNPVDAELLVRELRKAGFEPLWQRVETEPDYIQQLDRADFDLVLSDFQLPHFNGLRALQLFKERKLDMPFILISGTIGEEIAVEAIKQGATDYLLKDRLVRLGQVVTHALAECRLRRERRKSDDALLLFRTLMDQSGDTLEVIDPETARFLDVNGKGPAELGCTRTEYLSLRVIDLDPKMTEAAWTRFVATLRETGSLSGETSHRRKDGTTFPVEYRAKWVRHDRDYIVTVVRDISVRQKSEQALRVSEERFRQLAENILEVFWITSLDQNQVLYVSPAYEKIWGRTCESLHASLETWLDAIHPKDRARVQRAVAARLITGAYEEEYRILRPNGSERWIRDRAFPVRGPDGSLQRLVGVAEDITESKNLQEQFLRAQRMEAIGTLAGGIAHDLNNILAPILLAPPMLREFARDDREKELLDLVEKSAQRGANVVGQLLTFSRGTGGQHVSVQLCHLIAEMTGIMRETFPREIVIEQCITGSLAPILGDPTQLHQVLLNLCINARDAMEDGGKLSLTAKNAELSEAEVQAHAPAKAGAYVAVTVADTGHGMSAEILGRIFEPFFTTKSLSKGTGLGLSTVFGIVRSHHGFVTVASIPGKGTTFTVHLPVAPNTVETAAIPTAELPIGHGELILVVDDEVPIRTVTRLLLKRHGYRVLTACEGAEALVVFAEHRDEVRIVLTDVMMPGMGGVALIRSLRIVAPNLKVIAMSGLDNSENHVALVAAGAACILAKPCSLRELLETVHEHLSGELLSVD